MKTEFNGNISKASQVMGITRKMPRHWNKKEVKFANQPDKRVNRSITETRSGKYPLLEEQHLAWFKDQRKGKDHNCNFTN